MPNYSNYARSNLNVGWTEERIEQLKQLQADSLSASEIADELGGVSRSAVIGKLHRLGMAGGGKRTGGRPRTANGAPATARRPSKPMRIAAAFNFSSAAARAIVPAEPIDEAVAATDDAIPFTQRKQLVELNTGDCRWPVGDPGSPDFFFCGGEAEEGGSYCAFHARVAFEPIYRRRQSKAS